MTQAPKTDPLFETDWRVETVLREQRFPARKWQLLATADYYGADIHTREELWRLPEGSYRSVAQVIAVIKARTKS